MPEAVLDRCHCGDPLFPKACAKGEGEYLACHHCDRPCGSWGEMWSLELGMMVPAFIPNENCPRCIEIGKWMPPELRLKGETT